MSIDKSIMKDINLSRWVIKELFPEYIDINNQSCLCPGNIKITWELVEFQTPP